MLILCNAGSSSIKLAAATADAGNGHRVLESVNWPLEDGSPARLLERFRERLPADPVRAVLHRIVHAGPVSADIALLDETVRKAIVHWQVLAPRHNALARDLIDASEAAWPGARPLAVFDSGLYRSLPEEARRYPLPDGLSPDWPIARYGFHGLAHRSQRRQVSAVSSARRLVTLQLGSGCSATAWDGERVVDTSMGFTPLEGLPMARRSGSIDPGILLHLLQQCGYSPEQLARLLAEDSGLQGMAGTADMRNLLDEAGPVSEEADRIVSFIAVRIRKQLGAFFALLGGLDAVSFGGGVGEHQWWLRQAVMEELAPLGMVLDSGRNRQAGGEETAALHADGSPAGIYLTPVNEMQEMLRHYEAMPESAGN